MFRFILGTFLGVLAGTIATRYVTDLQAGLIGFGVALLIWVGVSILDELA
ncbi:hypothetical protein [Streptodolium elevatio]|uniref:GlsB/YeaQ/YmgE family stress response membrane protein n=1 Tax=Streptodolium elevatio TaxID=3157996 RepID=A0ABV3DJZ7_9ACTN